MRREEAKKPKFSEEQIEEMVETFAAEHFEPLQEKLSKLREVYNVLLSELTTPGGRDAAREQRAKQCKLGIKKLEERLAEQHVYLRDSVAAMRERHREEMQLLKGAMHAKARLPGIKRL